METLNRKMMQVAALHGMLPELLQVMGGGICEWRRDRDRHLHMHSPFVSDTHAAGKPRELLNLASVLIKQSMPVSYKVTME